MAPTPKLPPPAAPQHSRHFDPWNSVSTGHQRAETRGPQGWRASRNMKMNSQFRAGNSGGRRIPDAVGVGSDDFDDRLGAFVPKAVRARALNSVADMLRNPGSMRAASLPASTSAPLPLLGKGSAGGAWGSEDGSMTAEERTRGLAREAEDEALGEEKTTRAQERKIFDGLVIYVNGSTHPLVSDHRLKHLLSEHGARMSLHLGRRQVTHVILGKPSGPTGGAGGGLAGGKLQKEIRRVGGCGIKYVGVEWWVYTIHPSLTLSLSLETPLSRAIRILCRIGWLTDHGT